MNRMMTWGAALTAAVLLAGCGGTKKPQPASLTNFAPTLQAKVAWKADVGRSPKFEFGVGQFSPAVSGDAIYAASAAGAVSKINFADGRQLWRTQVGAPIVAGVATGSGASTGVSAVLTDRGEAVLIDADGKILRRIALGGVALEIPALLGSTLVARLADNRVAGWDIQTGARRWVIQRSLPPLVLHAQSGLRGLPQAPEELSSSVLGPGDLLVNMPGGRLVWLNITTGAVRWESQVVTPRGANEVERIIDLLGAPTVDGPDVCVAAYQTMVSCFGAESGRRLWSRDIVVSTPVAADTRFVYVSDDQSRLHALNRKDGTTAWTIDSFQLRNLMTPVSWGRAVWVADRFGYLHAVNREDGRLLARMSLDGGAPSGAIRTTRSGLLIQTQGGQLMLIRTEG
ncbi:outer membrane protein assembly factor BamB [beta proteobacterium MWH-UniP1]